MGTKQLAKFTCDYCKAVETHEFPLDPQKLKHWVEVHITRIIDGKEETAKLFFDSAKCAAQTLKLISENKVQVTKDSKPPAEPEPTSKVREIVKFDNEGHATEEKTVAAADTADPPRSLVAVE